MCYWSVMNYTRRIKYRNETGNLYNKISLVFSSIDRLYDLYSIYLCVIYSLYFKKIMRRQISWKGDEEVKKMVKCGYGLGWVEGDEKEKIGRASASYYVKLASTTPSIPYRAIYLSILLYILTFNTRRHLKKKSLP